MKPENSYAIPTALIISECIHGNERMQLLLYRQFAPAMYKLCLRYTRNTVEAEDILQEGFIKIFRNLDKFRGDGCFEGWLKKIIYRTAISYFRSTAKKVSPSHNDFNLSIEDNQTDVFDRLAEKDIVRSVTKLPSGYRTVFTMYVIEGYSHREIAGILGCSEGTCKSQLNRSRIHLQKMLKQSA